MIGKFFSLPKTRQFKYEPRFYDPVKEELAEREQRIKSELGIVDDSDPRARYVARIKGQFRKSAGKESKLAENAKRSSNRRLWVLIILLGLLFYFFFYR